MGLSCNIRCKATATLSLHLFLCKGLGDTPTSYMCALICSEGCLLAVAITIKMYMNLLFRKYNHIVTVRSNIYLLVDNHRLQQH